MKDLRSIKHGRIRTFVFEHGKDDVKHFMGDMAERNGVMLSSRLLAVIDGLEERVFDKGKTATSAACMTAVRRYLLPRLDILPFPVNSPLSRSRTSIPAAATNFLAVVAKTRSMAAKAMTS